MAADEDFLKRFDVNVWQRGDERAPHKPLLLLLALARLQRGDDRLMLFEDVDTKLAALLRDFGPARKTTHPELPFWYLQTDGIWELPEREELKAAVSHRKKTNLKRHLKTGQTTTLQNRP